MDIITGYAGKAHVTAEQDRDINQGIVGSGSYVLRTGMEMAAEVSSNNEIKIRDGVLMHQGCAASIKKNTYDSLTIVNGSQGMKRIDLIVARYSRSKDTGVESLKLIVIQGTPTTGTATVPSYTKGDIQAGDYVADMPMYQVILNGLNITEVKKVFETAPNLAEINSKIAKQLKSYQIKVTGIKVPANTMTRISIQSQTDFDKGLTDHGCKNVIAVNVLTGTYGDQVQASACLYNGALWLQIDSRYGAELTMNPIFTVIAN